MSLFNGFDFIDWLFLFVLVGFSIVIFWGFIMIYTGNSFIFYRFKELFQHEKDDLKAEIDLEKKKNELKRVESKINEYINSKDYKEALETDLDTRIHALSGELKLKQEELRSNVEENEKLQIQNQIQKQASDLFNNYLDEKTTNFIDKVNQATLDLASKNTQDTIYQAFQGLVNQVNQQNIDKDIKKRQMELDRLNASIDEQNKEKLIQAFLAALNLKIQEQLDYHDKELEYKRRINELEQRIKTLNAEQNDTVEQATKTSFALTQTLEATQALKNYCNNFNRGNNLITLAKLDELTCLQQFSKFLKSKNLNYPLRLIKAFHTSLKVQAFNPISVLAGLSGTGKTQLAMRYSEFFGFYSEHISVQPRWDSKDDLLGFYNFLEKSYQPTVLIKDLYNFDRFHKDKMLMVILDEMNLARIEYYFSDFLSKLELRAMDTEKSKITIGHGNDTIDINIGPNVLFVGTMNDDESTFSLSDKVLDRANVLYFSPPTKFKHEFTIQEKVPTLCIDKKTFNSWIKSTNTIDKQHIDNIERLNIALKLIGKSFGYRVERSMLEYIKQYPSNNSEGASLAFCDQVELKVMPKLSSVEYTDQLSRCLDEIKDLVSIDTELVNAINNASYEASNTGMFIWYGVQREVD